MKKYKIKGIEKKIMCISLVFLICTTLINPNAITKAYADFKEIDTQFHEVLSADKKSASIQMNITENKGQSIESVTLPDASKIEKTDFKRNESSQLVFLYTATENKQYDFVVSYSKKNNAEGVPAIESDVVTKEETHSYTLRNLVLEKQSAFTASPRASELEDYVKGTAKVSNLKLVGDASRNQVESGQSIAYDTQISISSSTGSANSVWLGLRYIIPKTSASGGTWTIDTSVMGWLLDFTDTSKVASVKTVGDTYVLEGKVLLKNESGPVIPGNSSWNLNVKNKNGVQGDTFQASVDAWLYSDGEANKQVAQSQTVTVTTKALFDVLSTWTNWSSLLSGYYNVDTGSFSYKEPEDITGYKYGRFFADVTGVIVPTAGSEKLDPTLPVSWDNTYKVVKTVDGAEVEETNADLQAILVGVKRNSSAQTTSELSGSSKVDMTVSNEIGLQSAWIDSNGDAIKGDYTFTKNGNVISNVAVLSKDNKNSGLSSASNYALYFVPLDSSDTDTTNRKLIIETGNLKGKSFAGLEISDADPTNNTRSFIVKKKSATPSVAQIGRKVALKYEQIASETNGTTGVLKAEVNVGTDIEDILPDYNINAINYLIKVEEGIQLQENWNWYKHNIYTGTKTMLYAVKPDGSGWKDEKEINNTQDYELVYYDTLAEAQKHGVVVGQLLELRGGIWKTGSYLLSETEYKVNGMNGSSYVAVQDVKVWQGKNELSTIDSYAGTNGTKVEEFKTPYSNAMFPYDNPANKSGVYQRNIWDEKTNAIVRKEALTYGDTLFVFSGSVVPKEMQVLNGNRVGTEIGTDNKMHPSSSYDVGLGERITDRSYSFEVNEVGNESIHVKVNLNEASDADSYKNAIKTMGNVLLSTADNPVSYKPNTNPAKRGTFEGGVVVNPLDFTVPGDGTYTLYYASEIGNPLDLSKDVTNGGYWQQSIIELYPESNRYAVCPKNSKAVYASIIKTTIEGVSKTETAKTSIDTLGYNLTRASGNSDSTNNFILDVLPFNGDGRGTSFHGTYTLTDGQIPLHISSSTGTVTSTMKVYYTTDMNIRTAGSDGSYATSNIFSGMSATTLPNSFTAGGSTWNLATDNGDGTWSTKSKEVPSAILFYGDIHRNEQMTATINLTLSDFKRGDSYVNVASALNDKFPDSIDSSKSEASVASRTIQGKAWIDKNANNVYDDGTDGLFENAIVKLYTSDDKEVLKDMDGKLYGEITTDSNGKYEFKNVPYEKNGYYVTFIKENMGINYMSTIKYANGATTPYMDDIDSDVDPVLNNGLLQSTKSDIMYLKSDDELINSNVDVQKVNIDAGYVEVTPSLEFKVAQDDVVVKLDTTLADIKDAIQASASVTTGGTTTDIASQIDWSTLVDFDTSKFGNSIDTTIKIENPITKKIETINVKVRTPKEISFLYTKTDYIVGDVFDVMKTVRIFDGDGNEIPFTLDMITENEVPIDAEGKLTTVGRTWVKVSCTDKYGYTKEENIAIKVHGGMKLYVPENKVVKVNDVVDTTQGATAVLEIVDNLGNIRHAPMIVRCTTPTITSSTVKRETVALTAECIIFGLTMKATASYDVSFNGLPTFTPTDAGIINVRYGGSLDEVKAGIAATNTRASMMTPDGEIDLTDQIDWQNVLNYSTLSNPYSGYMTSIFVTDPDNSKTIVNKKVFIILVPKPVWDVPKEINIVEGDTYNPMDNVTLREFNGTPITVTEDMITSDIPIDVDGKVTTRGNYNIAYQFTDYLGNVSTVNTSVKVHSQLNIENLTRIDLIEKDGYVDLTKAKAFYINSDGAKIEVLGTYNKSVDTSHVGIQDIEYVAIHPMNKGETKDIQKVYVHGKVEMAAPSDKTVKVNTPITPNEGANASYKHVNDDGSIVETYVPVTSSLDAPYTSTIAGIKEIPLSASVEIKPGLTTTTSLKYYVTFNGLPVINVSNPNITVRVGAGLEEIKTLLNAKASILYGDGTETDISENINWDEVKNIDTSKKGIENKVTISVRDRDGYMTSKEVCIKVSDSIIVNFPKVDLVVNDTFDPTKDVMIIDGVGKEINIDDVTIDDSNIDLTKPGNYEVSYKYTDSSGNSLNEKNIVHVHGALVFKQLDRVDLERKDDTTYVGTTAQAFYMNSDNKKVDVVVAYTNNVNQSKVGLTLLDVEAVHPINKKIVSSKQNIYVHGEITFVLTNTSNFKIGKKVNVRDVVSASYEHVVDSGRIEKKIVDVSMDKNDFTRNEVGYEGIHALAKIKVNALVLTNSIDFNVGFEGYPYIESVSSITMDVQEKTSDEIKAMMNVYAGMILADKTTADLTDKVTYIDISRVNTKKAGSYHVILSVEDDNGNKENKLVTITVNEKKPVISDKPELPIIPETPKQPDLPIAPGIPMQPTLPGVIVNPIPELKEPEDNYVIIAKDIPLSQLENGVNSELIQSYISAKSVISGTVGFEVISNNVKNSVGSYQVEVRLENGITKTIFINVVDDNNQDVQKPEYGYEENCYTHWLNMLVVFIFGGYVISVMKKRRKDIDDANLQNGKGV